MRSTRHLPALLALIVAALAACSSGDDALHGAPGPGDGSGADGGAATDPTQAAPFEPVGPLIYVAKVKTLLTGLPATDAEVQAVVKDPNALRGLIDQWMTLPSFELRMLDFFRNAFQQNQIDLTALGAALQVKFPNTAYAPTLARNLMDSFPMTVWELIKEGRSFQEALTTNRYMLTTSMMSFMSYIDNKHVADEKGNFDRMVKAAPVPQITFDSVATPTLAQSLDPTSPQYMVWSVPVTVPGCATTRVTLQAAGNGGFYDNFYQFFVGKASFDPCPTPGKQNQVNVPAQYGDADSTDWRMVTLHTDAAAPLPDPVFYDLLKLRAASDLTLHTQRIGFFGTLAFDANWASNVTNEARVTANQALIVALGESIAGENTIVTFPVTATDANHATDPSCKGCHSQLDPYKQFFRQSYSLYYSDQADPAVIAQPANFTLGGPTTAGRGVLDLANIFANHPRFPLAWAAKLHFWANSTPALENDPELLRIAAAFQASKFDFKTLVRELFSSPLITYASGTATTRTNGVIDSIARRDQFCAALSNRLGLPDVCGMLSTKQTAPQKVISSRALLMPVDTYYRAFALPSLPTNPDLFFRQSVEAICELVADQVIDVKGGTSLYMSTNPEPALDAFVGTVMGLVPSDPRAKAVRPILEDTFTSAKATGASATDSLKAAFTVACVAPTSIAVGL